MTTPTTSPQALARALLLAAEKAEPGPWALETTLLVSLSADWTPVRSLHGPDRINLSELAAKGFIEHRRDGDVSEFRTRSTLSGAAK